MPVNTGYEDMEPPMRLLPPPPDCPTTSRLSDGAVKNAQSTWCGSKSICMMTIIYEYFITSIYIHRQFGHIHHSPKIHLRTNAFTSRSAPVLQCTKCHTTRSNGHPWQR